MVSSFPDNAVDGHQELVPGTVSSFAKGGRRFWGRLLPLVAEDLSSEMQNGANFNGLHVCAGSVYRLISMLQDVKHGQSGQILKTVPPHQVLGTLPRGFPSLCWTYVIIFASTQPFKKRG